VAIDGDDYLIEPVKGYDGSHGEHPHLLYKRSALTVDEDDHHATCGNQGIEF
jgi:hypothetical protein